MKLALNLFLTLFALFVFDDESFSLTNYQMNKICRKEKRVASCIKNLQEKRNKLQKGNPIEIPIKPYKN
tara:strand:- start:284 stop:490 length:207 start_codon:yes stop_codon:yes gene_type:complete